MSFCIYIYLSLDGLLNALFVMSTVTKHLPLKGKGLILFS